MNITIIFSAALAGFTLIATAAFYKITEIKRADRNKIEAYYHRGY